jgi:peptidoglycan LD-endopeptidase CwlK
MSSRLFASDVKFLQRMLCSAGCYSGRRDGVWSQTVDEADVKLGEMADAIAARHGTFDERTERNIRTLHPRAQDAARRFLAAVRAAGIDARVISGTRTYAEQDALYAIGRSGDARKPVTKAQGGHSNHNFGIAWDIGVFEGGKYLTREAPYVAAASFCPAGIEWGGHWVSFRDTPHYQLAVDKKLSEIRACFEQGTPFVPA